MNHLDNEPRPRRAEESSPELSERETETAWALALLDAQLAGMFEHGIGLARRVADPGVAHMLAYIGRELSRGVLRRVLEDEGLVLRDEDPDGFPEGEGDRGRIARALDLPAEDPRVGMWFRLPRLFAEWEKYRYGGPPSDQVRGAFEVLCDLLYGRVAPYYVTEAELDELLAIQDPGPEHMARLQRLQLRAAQRRYLFGKLSNPRWVRPLTAGGFFSQPPDLQITEDGSMRSRPWPEGQFLARIAPEAPEAVAEALESIPQDNKNPLVWDLVAKAAAQLPSDIAVRLVPAVVEALKQGPIGRLSHSVVDLVEALAETGSDEAFTLADHLLYVVDIEVAKDLENIQARTRTDWVFPRLGWHGHSELVERLIGALARLDSERALRLVLSKLRRVERLSEDADLRLLWSPSAARPDGHPDAKDAVGMLGEGVAKLAGRIAAQGPSEANDVMKLLDTSEGPAFTRLRYRVLESAGHHLAARVDAVLLSREATNPGYPASSFASFLSAQFANASPQARAFFAARLRAGANRDVIRKRLEPWHGEAVSVDQVDEAIRGLQRRVLTFFRGEIPEELRALAEDLGMWSVKPSHRDQALAERGSYAEAGAWGRAAPSPLSDEDLTSWPINEIVEFLVDQQEGESREIAPGLPTQLSTWASTHPVRAVALVDRGIESGVAPEFISSLLDGTIQSLRAGRDLDWRDVVEASAKVIARVSGLPGEPGDEAQHWRRAAGNALRLVGQGCDGDAIPVELASDLWGILRQAADARLIWELAPPQLEDSLASVLMARRVDATGEVAAAVMSAALWQYRARDIGAQVASEERDEAAKEAVRGRLLPVLDRWLDRGGPNAVIPRAVIGDYLPQLCLLAPDWVEDRAPALLEGGVREPGTFPTWTTYVARSPLYDSPFRTLRRWYVEAAEHADTWRAGATDPGGGRQITELFAEHLVAGFLQALITLDDEDRLMQVAYRTLRVSDWGHAYWTVFRRWSDSGESPPPEFVTRLVDLWDWRISELQGGTPSARVTEEAQALAWFFHTPHLPAEEVIRLGRSTAGLAAGKMEMYSKWEDLSELAKQDPGGVFEIAELILDARLRSEFPHVPVEDVRPLLAEVLQGGNEHTRARVRRLVNRLGERGFRDFKDLSLRRARDEWVGP